MERTLQKCKGCERRVGLGVLYCCAACRYAHEMSYEIHETGPLAHSDGCNQRHAERSAALALRGA